MGYLRKFLVLLAVLSLFWAAGLPASADPTDEATLGGQDSSARYRWRVDSSGDFIPGADDTYDIGDSTHEVQDIYSDGTVYSDAISNSGNIQFQTNIYASGHYSGATQIASTVTPLTSANIAFGLVQFSNGSPGSYPLPDGVTGQMLTLELLADPCIYIQDDTAGDITKTGWASIVLDTAHDRVTLLWADDTTGWVITANSGCSITY